MKLANLVQTVARSFGYRIVRAPGSGPGRAEYEVACPVATYAPWNVEEAFLTTYQSVRANTLVDIYRCWELWTLVAQAAKLEGAILEVGVWRGGTGALMAKRAILAGIPDPVFLCDTFQGIVKAGIRDPAYKGGEHSNCSRKNVEELLTALNLTNVRTLKGIFPDETGELIGPDTRFRLCHIDVDVYRSAKDIIEWVWDRMVPGGIIVYDDYGFSTCQGIRDFVNEQLPVTDRLVLHNLNGHAIVVKTPNSRCRNEHGGPQNN